MGVSERGPSRGILSWLTVVVARIPSSSPLKSPMELLFGWLCIDGWLPNADRDGLWTKGRRKRDPLDGGGSSTVCVVGSGGRGGGLRPPVSEAAWNRRSRYCELRRIFIDVGRWMIWPKNGGGEVAVGVSAS